jgi:hypothetical protein
MTSAPELQTYRYRIDGDGLLREVSPNWDAFALANEGAHLVSEHVLGRSLLEFISDETARMLYGLLFQRIGDRGQAVRFPFRCDSPDLRRFMEMTLLPGGDGGVVLESRVKRVEARPAIAFLDVTAARSDELVRVCSWCKRALHEGTWLELEDFIGRSSLMSGSTLPLVTHGMCPACARAMDRQIARITRA